MKLNSPLLQRNDSSNAGYARKNWNPKLSFGLRFFQSDEFIS
ncbi:hypothetical protein [Sphingobacterium sp. HMA12]|nr:hypothetical protein [Sphingobacterium sp. HMA12]